MFLVTDSVQSLSLHDPLSKSEQVYSILCELIETGKMPRGFRLPSTRILAGQLSVSRTTVANAYSRLQERGYVNLVIGRGTYVHHQLDPDSCCIAVT